MANIQESIIPNLVDSQVDGDTLKVNANVHFVEQNEASRRRGRDLLADRVTIARAHELGFWRRMGHGLTETYQHLRTRELLASYHDNSTAINLNSAAMDEAVQAVGEIRANEGNEAQALALKTNLTDRFADEDAISILDGSSAGSLEQQQILASARDIVANYAQGAISRAELVQRATSLTIEVRDELPELFNRSAIGSDFIFIAESVREAYLKSQHQIAKIDVDLQLALGTVAGGIETQERRDLADRVIDWTQGSRKRSVLVNPLTIGVATAVGAVAIKAPAKAIPVIGGLAGGAFAFARRWSKENKDRYLKQREEEIGLEIPGPDGVHNAVERVFAAAVGQTDFRDYSYQPVQSLETQERLDGLSLVDLTVKGTAGWQDEALLVLADTRERMSISQDNEVGLVSYGRNRREDGQVEVTGLSRINNDKLNLLASCVVLERELVGVLGEAEFDRRYRETAHRRADEIAHQVENADSRFLRKKGVQSLRSGLFAGAVGTAGGYGIHYAAEGVEKLSEKVADFFGKGHEVVVPGGEKTEQLHGDLRAVAWGTDTKDGLKVELPEGYSYHFDQKGLITIDGDGRHFEVAYNQSMSLAQVHNAFAKAGLDGNISLENVRFELPDQMLSERLKDPDFLEKHGIVDITDKSHGISFGHAPFLRSDIGGDGEGYIGQHDYNELTMYRNSPVDWSMGPHGLDGSAVSPFVYTEHPAWADPTLVANAPVAGRDLVAFYQYTDGHGINHTLIQPQADGHFKMPEEFVNPTTGQVDGVRIVGYGMLVGADGKTINSQAFFVNPDVAAGGSLHSMASLPFEQADRPLPAGGFNVGVVNVEDLKVKVPFDEVVTQKPNHDFDRDFWTSTPFAPRIFPRVGDYKSNEGYFPVYVPGNYLRTSEEMRQEIKQNLSQVLKDNPEAVLDSKGEMQAYLERQPKDWMKKVARRVRSMKTMEPDVRAVVAIPVASHQEGDNIYKTLTHYAGQVDTDGNSMSSKFEIILHLNRPKISKADKTASEVKRFVKDHPEMRIRVINSVFDQKEPIGTIRKFATDVAIARAVKGGAFGNDLIIISNDADAIDITEKYVSSLIETFDSATNRHIDAVLGKIEWWDDVLKKYPTFYAANRFFQYLDASLRHAPEGMKHIGSSGANFAFRASTYSAVGGYNPDFMGEDVVLGTKIKVARAGEGRMIPNDRYPIQFSNRSRVSTNPRRGLAKYLEGKAVVEQWDDFDKSDYVRDLDIQEFVNRPPEEFDVKRLESEINAAISAYRLYPDMDIVRRSLDFLKLSWHVDGGRIRIDDTSRLEASFKRFADLVSTQDEILDVPEDSVQHHDTNVEEETNTEDSGEKKTLPKWMDVYLKEQAQRLNAQARSEGSLKRYKAEGGVKGDLKGYKWSFRHPVGKYTKAEFNKLMRGKKVVVLEDHGLSAKARRELEQAAVAAVTKASADLGRRSLFEWIKLLDVAKRMGVESDDLDDLDDFSRLLPKIPMARLSPFYRKRMTKHGALKAIRNSLGLAA